MPNQRLLAILTMLIMTGTTGSARSELSVGDLQSIEGLIQGQDCTALWEHLRVTPRLRRGNDPIAVELRKFYNSTRRGDLNCFSGRGGIFATPQSSDSY
ncbi:MAG: hypothetical protein ACRCSU_10670 [Paracoccaceae bacterium]